VAAALGAPLRDRCPAEAGINRALTMIPYELINYLGTLDVADAMRSCRRIG
jgi:hypothetical protein